MGGWLLGAPGNGCCHVSLAHPRPRPSHPTRVSLHAEVWCSSLRCFLVAFCFMLLASMCRFFFARLGLRRLSVSVYFSGNHICGEKPSLGESCWGFCVCFGFFLSNDDVSLPNTHTHTDFGNVSAAVANQLSTKNTVTLHDRGLLNSYNLEKNLVVAAFRLIRC